MATSKAKSQLKKETNAKAASKAKKSSTAAKPATTRRASTVKSAPAEDEIRAKAMEIYNERLSRGLEGTAESDWLQAEKIMMGKKK
jgi:hypothetical protein